MMDKTNSDIWFSVLMPVYNQAAYIRRAIASLMAQTYPCFELIIINDGSTDRTEEFIADYRNDKRIVYLKNEANQGMGQALNRGLDTARYDYVAYLPADDFYDTNHLETMRDTFRRMPDVVLAYSGIAYDESPEPGILSYRKCKGAIPGYSLQLVQTAHRRTADRWTERSECVSEDLFFLFWRKLADKGVFAFTGKTTCAWTNHPYQRHKLCGEKFGGGLNKYRAYYNVQTPVRFRSTPYKTTDETALYAPYRKPVTADKNGLKILLVGELAYNPERIYALEEAGHRLYGLWAKPRFCYSTVGPLPFGHVETIPYEGWKERVKEISPDIIYALLSTSAIDLAHEVMTAELEVPMVWHFKEGPHEARKAGLWEKLIDLYTYADGKIYINPEIREWFDLFAPKVKDAPVLIMDGDLPKAECFAGTFSPKLSAKDGEVHTVVAGRIIGLQPAEFKALAENGIHLHVYSENYIAGDNVLDSFQRIAPAYIHVHRHCAPSEWVREFSQYDAGWLHCIGSSNGGSLLKATWADLNLPARINTLAAAGLPMIQRRNEGHVFAQYSYVERRGMGISYTDIHELARQLRDKRLLAETSHRVMEHRKDFVFDNHVRELTDFFRKVIAGYHGKRNGK